MAQALYRKYRPKKLSDVVGQEHITSTLDNALKSGKLSHAYLFTGPHGVGKTSIARILAHEVNGLKYDDESSHLDIIEIDAASNRRIDEIRDIRDKVHISPTSAKYKVYIIDEVHMLTREAFNALLKTLEEPPAHVIFILATTEVHKLPETIISRTQRYSFKPIEISSAIKQLALISQKEGIDADEEALRLIAEQGDGSFRDSISLLDQSRHTGKLTSDDVRRILGIAPDVFINKIIEIINTGTAIEIIKVLQELKDLGYQPTSIAKQISEKLREAIINDSSQMSANDSLALLSKLLQVPTYNNPEQYLEITLLGVVLGNNEQTIAKPIKAAAIASPSPVLKIETIAPEITEHIKQTEPAPKAVKVTKPVKKPELEKIVKITPDDTNFVEVIWPTVLHELKTRHSTLYGVLRMSTASFGEQTLTLLFRFPFHQKQMKDSKNHKKLYDIISEKIDTPITIIYEMGQKGEMEEPAAIKETAAPAKDTNIDTVSNIFAGAEVLES
ncbi:MAG: DNA polymerase III subunit gamma/tau [Candidatus Saccharibacteria bacterium]